MTDVPCLRCGQKAPQVNEEKPYPGVLGEQVRRHICQPCWEAWRKFSVNVINDYKLKPFLPQDRAVVEQHMKQFLNLASVAPQPVTLSGQGHVVTFGKEVAEKTPEKVPTKEQVIDMLEQVFDPEIPVNIYDLGLIYDIAIADGRVSIKMTLTSPHCPAAQSLPSTVREAVSRIAGVREAEVIVVWDPPWTRDRISEEGKQTLGF